MTSNGSKVDHIRNPGSAATCQIWEAARATSAAPKYFAPILIDEKLFIDGGFGTNNPTFEAFNELTQSKRDIPLDPLMISVGSGTGRRRSRLKTSRIKPLIVSNIYSAFDLATDTDRVHQQMSIIARERKFAYFRFSVDEGLEDILLDNWEVQKTDGKKSFKTISHIIAQTKIYIQRQDIQQELRSCAQLLVDRLKMKTPSPRPTRISSVPFNRDTDFVGRESFLSRLDQGFSGLNRMALVGIGGVGYAQHFYLIPLSHIRLILPDHKQRLIIIVVLANLRSLSNTLTVSKTIILTAGSSGFMLVLEADLNKVTGRSLI